MTSPAQKPLFANLWARIKRFFVLDAAGSSEAPDQLQRRIRFLEQCLRKDDVIATTRVRLEHNWEDVAT